MAKLTQSGSKQWETPQITTKQTATERFGGMAPSHVDVIKSANARAQMRHEVKSTHLADTEVLPDSAELEGNEMVGILDRGYLSKKNIEYGVNAMFNSLPPGMDIEDQENCDIRQEQMVVFDRGLSYPGDGWTTRTRGAQMPRSNDLGRPEKTNFMGTSNVNSPAVKRSKR
jgi:hypothetical protein